MSRNKTPGETPRRRKSERRGQDVRPTAPAGAGWIYGMHAVLAALENPARRIRRLVATTEAAEKISPAYDRMPPEKLDRAAIEALLPPGAVHQGIALLTEPLEQPSLEEVIDSGGEHTVVVVLDQVTDPHNIGAVLRSAAAFGARAVIQTERGAPGATATVAKSASGALEIVPLVTVTNLSRALDKLRQADFWRIGLEGKAERTLAELAPLGRTALVFGAEGKGLRHLTREHCDLLARLPTKPPVASLNISNAAAVALYELNRQ